MRGLALARLHYLSRSRSERAVLICTLLMAVVPIVLFDAANIRPMVGWRLPIIMGASEQWPMIEELLRARAKLPTVVYGLHLIALLVTCDLLGLPKRTRDLTETAPITPAARFLGDALGVFECAGVVHLCTLPLLALSVAVSPLPARVFFFAEGVVLAALVLASAGAAWKMRSSGKWMHSRSVRSQALFATLFLLILMAGTRWSTFRDAAWMSLVEPAPARWREAASAIPSVPLLFALLFLLYAGFFVYFFLSSMRSQEKLHAL